MIRGVDIWISIFFVFIKAFFKKEISKDEGYIERGMCVKRTTLKKIYFYQQYISLYTATTHPMRRVIQDYTSRWIIEALS